MTTETERQNAAMYGPAGEHEHAWGNVDHAWMTGNPHRKCTVDGCRWISLDLSDDEMSDCDGCGDTVPDDDIAVIDYETGLAFCRECVANAHENEI